MINWANPEDVRLSGIPCTGTTSLFAASNWGHTDVVKVLVSLPGIDINKADKHDRTPLSVAKNEEIKAFLRAKGAE